MAKEYIRKQLMQLIEQKDSKLLAEQLGDTLIAILRDAISERGSASLVVSGGSTPKPLFEYLSHSDIEWEKVNITLADERCVDDQHDDSNARFVREFLLKNNASNANFVSLYNPDLAIDQQAKFASQQIATLNDFDIVILGMGGDGHTASLFPEATNLESGLDMQTSATALLTDPVTVGPLRITMTRPRLLNTGFLCVHFTGAGKWKIFEEILTAAKPNHYPLSHFIHQDQTPISVYYAP